MFQLAPLESCHRDYHNRRKRGEENNGAAAKKCAMREVPFFRQARFTWKGWEPDWAIFAFCGAIPSVCGEDSKESYQEMTVAVDTAQITDSAARSASSGPPLVLPSSVKAERGATRGTM